MSTELEIVRESLPKKIFYDVLNARIIREEDFYWNNKKYIGVYVLTEVGKVSVTSKVEEI